MSPQNEDEFTVWACTLFLLVLAYMLVFWR
jgi:hypothetical protein